ncbi:MAG: NAD(P)-binding protein [Pseudomonadota bacterium]
MIRPSNDMLTKRPTLRSMSIAIIGAGLAGVSAARALQPQNHPIELFEKSGGFGGRCATRRSDFGPFNHGAPRLHNLPEDLTEHLTKDQDGYRPPQGISTLARDLAADLTVHLRHEIDALHHTPEGWQIDQATYATLILAIPAPQAARLLKNHPFTTRLQSVTADAQLTAMLAYDTPQHVTPNETITQVEPMDESHTRWVVHGSPEFTATHLEKEKAEIAQLLAKAASETAPTYAAGHRWRYARTATPLGEPFLWDPTLRLGLCGDWCLGPSAGDAVKSGRALAEHVASA